MRRTQAAGAVVGDTMGVGVDHIPAAVEAQATRAV